MGTKLQGAWCGLVRVSCCGGYLGGRVHKTRPCTTVPIAIRTKNIAIFDLHTIPRAHRTVFLSAGGSKMIVAGSLYGPGPETRNSQMSPCHVPCGTFQWNR